MWCVQVEDRADDHLGVRIGAPRLHLFDADRGTGGVAASGVLVAEVHVDGHLAGLGQRPDLAVGVQHHCEVVAGDHAECHRAAHVQGLGGSAGFELGGGLGDRGLQVQGVGGVHRGDHVDGAGAVRVAGVHVDAASLRGRLPPRLGLDRVVGVQGLPAEPLGQGHPDLVGDRGQPPVHVRRPRGRERQGVLGDPGGPPPGQLPVGDACPESREPVPGLEHLADVSAARVGGHAERGREVDHRELGHARRPRTGQRETGVPAVLHDRRRIGFVDLVLGAPVNDQPELTDLLGRLAGGSRTASSRVASLPGRGSCAVAVMTPIRPATTHIHCSAASACGGPPQSSRLWTLGGLFALRLSRIPTVRGLDDARWRSLLDQR